MTSSSEAIVPPERPDLASERPPPEAAPPTLEGPEVPRRHPASEDDRLIDDVVERDHPLS
jgi:hypothetical protein